MSALSRAPTNKNYLSPTGFQFQLKKIPNTEFFVQAANLPGLILGQAIQPTPFASNFFPGDDITYEEFNLRFIVDEDLNNWKELYNWVTSIGRDTDFEKYRRERNKSSKLNPDSGELYSDATLNILTNAKNANIQVVFFDMFPVALSSLEFDYTSSDIEFLTSDVTFRYRTYEIR